MTSERTAAALAALASSSSEERLASIKQLSTAQDVTITHSFSMDLDPEPSGKVGQIFFFDHERGASGVEANSFLEWLTRYADASRPAP